jgi:hypothetical protein
MQSVIFIGSVFFHTTTRNVILTGTNVIKTRTSVIFIRTRMIFPRRVRFYTQSVSWYAHCDLHTHECSFDTFECDYDTHEYDNDILVCDLYTHSAASTRSVILTGTNVIASRMRVISTRTRVVSTRRVWLRHAVCGCHARSDFYWKLCENNTHKSNFYTHSKISTLTHTFECNFNI